MAESWVRLWAGMTTDPKWQTIARKSGQPRALVIALFTHLMLEANEADDRGRVSGANIEDVASALDCDEDAIHAILEAMQGRVIVDGKLAGWDRRQPKREDSGSESTGSMSSTERSRLYREKKRQQQQGNACNGDATHATAMQRKATQGNAPEAEAEAEKHKPRSKAAASQSPPEPREAQAVLPPDPGRQPDFAPDNAAGRNAQIAVLLRRNGADPATHPRSKGIADLAASGATDVQILTALEAAKQRRLDSADSRPVSAAYLVPILRQALATPPSRASPGRPAKFDPVEHINQQRLSRQMPQESTYATDQETIIDIDAVRVG